MTIWQMLTAAAPVRSAADTNPGGGQSASPAGEGGGNGAPTGGSDPGAEGGQSGESGQGSGSGQSGESGQGNGSGQSGESGQGNGSGESGDFAWFADDLTPEERRTLEAKNFKSPRDLFKSMRSAEKAVRGDYIPGPPDNPDERSAWFAEQVAPRLGVPDSPDKYEIGKPEWAEEVAPYVEFGDERQSKFLSAAHELGLTPDQAKGVLNLYAEETTADVQRHMQQAQADQTEMQAELKKEWGRNFDQNLRAAVETAREFGIDENQAEALRSGNVMGSAALAKAMHELAQLRGDDGMKGGGTAAPGQTREQAQKQLDEFSSRNGAALTTRDHPQHAWAMDEYRRLQKAAGRGSHGRQ